MGYHLPHFHLPTGNATITTWKLILHASAGLHIQTLQQLPILERVKNEKKNVNTQRLTLKMNLLNETALRCAVKQCDRLSMVQSPYTLTSPSKNQGPAHL